MCPRLVGTSNGFPTSGSRVAVSWFLSTYSMPATILRTLSLPSGHDLGACVSLAACNS